MANSVYSCLNTILTVNQRIIKGGQTEPNIYTFESEAPRVSVTASLDKTGTFSITPVTKGRLMVRLLGTHPDNTFFATLYQELDLGGSVVPFPVSLKQVGGDFLIAGTFLIENVSEGALGTELEPRTWTMVSPNVTVFQGALAD